MHKLKLLFLLLMMQMSISAQIDSLLVEFTGIVSNDDVQLDWILKGGYQCNGTIIQRSTDGKTFENIGQIVGICGSTNKNEYYSFVDLSPIANVDNYYRLVLGNYGESRAIKKSFYRFEKSSILIFPNPATDKVNVVVNNRNRQTWSFVLYDITGRVLLHHEQREEAFQLNRANHHAGTYIYHIVIDTEIITGKIIFQ